MRHSLLIADYVTLVDKETVLYPRNEGGRQQDETLRLILLMEISFNFAKKLPFVAHML